MVDSEVLFGVNFPKEISTVKTPQCTHSQLTLVSWVWGFSDFGAQGFGDQGSVDCLRIQSSFLSKKYVQGCGV